MATRGRPKGSKNQISNHIVINKPDFDAIRLENNLLSTSNEELLKTTFSQAKVIQEQESEIGKLEDENEHLKEIIKSLAEVL